MGGASNRSDDSGGGSSYSSQLKKIQKPNPVVKFIQGGGVTGAIVRGVVKAGKAIKQDYKTRKTNEALLGSSDYQGGKTFSSSTVNTGGNNDRGGNDNPILSTNTEATKQVASSGIVTNNGIVAPTTAEVSQATATDATSTLMSDAEISVANKKKGRSTTILNRATGLGNSSLNTTKKTLGA